VVQVGEPGADGVPQDLSVIGFDDAPQSAFVQPQLTTVRLDLEVLGRAAFSRLRTLVEPVQAPTAHVWAEPGPSVRDSSAARRSMTAAHRRHTRPAHHHPAAPHAGNSPGRPVSRPVTTPAAAEHHARPSAPWEPLGHALTAATARPRQPTCA
jgi:hypothetical protein